MKRLTIMMWIVIFQSLLLLGLLFDIGDWLAPLGIWSLTIVSAMLCFVKESSK